MKKMFCAIAAIAAILVAGLAYASYTNSVPLRFVAYPHHAHRAGFQYCGMVLMNNGKTIIKGYGNFVTSNQVNVTETPQRGVITSWITVASTNVMWNSTTQRLEEPDLGLWFTPTPVNQQ